MLADLAAVVQVADLLLLLTGVLVLVGLGVSGWRRNRWADPLAAVPLPVSSPDIARVLAACILFFGAHFVLVELAVRDRPRAELAHYGSDTWFRAQAATLGAQLVATAFMVLLLGRCRSAPGAASCARRQGGIGGLVTALVAFVILLPVVAVLWNAGNVVWKWAHPALPPPIHPVLLAIEGGAWGTWGTVQLCVGAVVVGPLAEELLFRGVLLGGLCRAWGLAWPAILLSAAAFGLVHGQPQDILPLIVMGVVLGFVRLWTGRLWPCVVTHMLFNARTIVLALLAPQMLRPL